MNTFRKLLLIALVGIATAPAYTMYADDLAQDLTNALDEAQASQVASDVASEATTGRLAQIKESVIQNGGKFSELATNHPYRTFGIIAVVVTAGTTTYVLYKTGKLKPLKQAIKDHKISASVITATIAAGGTYVAAKQMGYDLSLSSAKDQVSTLGSFIYNKLPNKPSWNTTKSYLFNWKTAGLGATLLGVGYVVNKFYNGSTKDTNNKNPELPNKTTTTKSWKLPSLFSGSSNKSTPSFVVPTMVTEQIVNQAIKDGSKAKAQALYDRYITTEGYSKTGGHKRKMQQRINSL